MTQDPDERWTATELDRADALRKSDPTKAESSYRAILSRKAGGSTLDSTGRVLTSLADEGELKDQETALLNLGTLYRDGG